MFRIFRKAIWPSRNDRLSQSFSSLGWLGFWMQIAIGSVPLALIIFALAFGRNPAPGTRAGFPLIEYLSIAGLLVARVYDNLVVSLHTPCRPSRRSNTPPNKNCCAANSVDWCQGEHDRNRIVDAGHAFRSRTASDLFSPHATGRRSSDPDHRGTGELGVRSRYRRSVSSASHYVRGGYRSDFQPLALVAYNTPVGRISSNRR